MKRRWNSDQPSHRLEEKEEIDNLVLKIVRLRDGKRTEGQIDDDVGAGKRREVAAGVWEVSYRLSLSIMTMKANEKTSSASYLASQLDNRSDGPSCLYPRRRRQCSSPSAPCRHPETCGRH